VFALFTALLLTPYLKNAPLVWDTNSIQGAPWNNEVFRCNRTNFSILPAPQLAPKGEENLASSTPSSDAAPSERRRRRPRDQPSASAPAVQPADRANSNVAAITSVDKLRFLTRTARDKRLNSTDLRCAIVIANYFNSAKGRAWPSYARLVKDTGASRASVARSVKKLDELGLIYRDRGHTGRSNSYVPAFDAPEMASEASTTPSHGRETTSLTGETTSVSSLRQYPTRTPRSIQRRGVLATPRGLAPPLGLRRPPVGPHTKRARRSPHWKITLAISSASGTPTPRRKDALKRWSHSARRLPRVCPHAFSSRRPSNMHWQKPKSLIRCT
jgi:Helix-turn-helix domain